MLVDLRDMPRELQVIAYEKGMILHPGRQGIGRCGVSPLSRCGDPLRKFRSEFSMTSQKPSVALQRFNAALR